MIHYIPNPASNAYTHLYDEHCVVVPERGEEFRVHPLYAFEVQAACRAAYSLGLEHGARHIEDREVPAPSYVLAAEIRALKPTDEATRPYAAEGETR